MQDIENFLIQPMFADQAGMVLLIIAHRHSSRVRPTAADAAAVTSAHELNTERDFRQAQNDEDKAADDSRWQDQRNQKTKKADKPLVSRALSATSILFAGEIGG
ncbi:hypothetical protein [Rhizobium sp. WYJ-E13]|uniref:hypothetical protein n=1 Tax=Rhizobium sp. WYJ-E13 TaxID=2849093 RepID=UPI001C1EB983|nr:hypothetical protein [Rhizobium sp. WYJ-E13]QWW70361.1 hypothetical protein KQ933_12075 [Rhizobium sp. WYJ-E13]